MDWFYDCEIFSPSSFWLGSIRFGHFVIFLFFVDACGFEVIMCWISALFLRSYSFLRRFFFRFAYWRSIGFFPIVAAVTSGHGAPKYQYRFGVFARIFCRHQYSISWPIIIMYFSRKLDYINAQSTSNHERNKKNEMKTNPTVLPRNAYTETYTIHTEKNKHITRDPIVRTISITKPIIKILFSFSSVLLACGSLWRGARFVPSNCAHISVPFAVPLI